MRIAADRIATVLAAVALWTGAPTSVLACLVWTYGPEGVSSGTGPNRSAWLQASVNQVNDKKVSVRLDWLNVPKETELLGFYMDYDDTPKQLSVSGPPGFSMLKKAQSFSADTGHYDLLMQSAVPGKPFFAAAGHSMAFTIDSSSPLEVWDFYGSSAVHLSSCGEDVWVSLSKPSGYADKGWSKPPKGGHEERCKPPKGGGGDKDWHKPSKPGGGCDKEKPPVIPEPTALIAALLLLLPLAASALKVKSRR